MTEDFSAVKKIIKGLTFSGVGAEAVVQQRREQMQASCRGRKVNVTPSTQQKSGVGLGSW